MALIYRNRTILNQRGASIAIDNTTDSESVNLSHRSGSNIEINSLVNSELATNNKQTLVINDIFETTGNNRTQFVGNHRISRTSGNTYELNGFTNKTELDNMRQWREIYSDFAKKNSLFRIQRGGTGYPNGETTELQGTRANNPTLQNNILSVENEFHGYTGTPIRRSNQDDVVTYAKVPDKGVASYASVKNPSSTDVSAAGGPSGSEAPGILEFGSSVSAATEGGSWTPTPEHSPAQATSDWQSEKVCGDLEGSGCWDGNGILTVEKTGGGSTSSSVTSLANDINEIHKSKLVLLEQEMGDFGDDVKIIKRNKLEQVGAEFNDYPSVRIDPKGRSQPLEHIVCEKGSFTNHDAAPHCEEVDNSSNFLCGNDDKVVGNRYARTVGSGGIHLKTTGSIELGGTVFQVGAMKAHINASHGIVLSSDENIDIESLKSITLRTNRQVYVENSLGVKKNLTVGGGTYAEGELYCHHVTAPLEVQQTEDTVLFGKFATDTDRSLLIGEAHVGNLFYPVYAKMSDDLIVNYPHSHHFNNLPLRLCKKNKDVRKFAMNEGVNSHGRRTQALPQVHERKTARSAS